MLITCNNRSGQELTLADVLVIRPPVDRPITNAAVFAESLAPVYQRVVKLPVHVLGSNDFSICLSTNTHPSSEPILKEDEHPLLVKALREAELAEIAQRTKTIIQADAATIFRTHQRVTAIAFCVRLMSKRTVAPWTFSSSGFFRGCVTAVPFSLKRGVFRQLFLTRHGC